MLLGVWLSLHFAKRVPVPGSAPVLDGFGCGVGSTGGFFQKHIGHGSKCTEWVCGPITYRVGHTRQPVAVKAYRRCMIGSHVEAHGQETIL